MATQPRPSLCCLSLDLFKTAFIITTCSIDSKVIEYFILAFPDQNSNIFLHFVDQTTNWELTNESICCSPVAYNMSIHRHWCFSYCCGLTFPGMQSDIHKWPQGKLATTYQAQLYNGQQGTGMLLYALSGSPWDKLEVKNTVPRRKQSLSRKHVCSPRRKPLAVDSVPAVNSFCMNAHSEHLSPSAERILHTSFSLLCFTLLLVPLQLFHNLLCLMVVSAQENTACMRWISVLEGDIITMLTTCLSRSWPQRFSSISVQIKNNKGCWKPK